MNKSSFKDCFSEKTRKLCVEEVFSVDSFEIARKTFAGVGQNIYVTSPLANQNMLSVSVRLGKENYYLWPMVIDQRFDHVEVWSAIHEESPETRNEIFAGSSMCWSKEETFSLVCAEFFAPLRVEREVTTSPAGGRCSWFKCPQTNLTGSCLGRCRKLYFVNGKFACRQCHNLAYKSQRIDEATRYFDKARKIWQGVLEQLDDDERGKYEDDVSSFPPIPPTMSYPIYKTLEMKWQLAGIKRAEAIMRPVRIYCKNFFGE